MIDLAALERDLRAARGGRPPPAGMLDVVVEDVAGVPLARPRDWELLCERGGESPFWATVWPSGAALARAIAAGPERVAGRRVLELGCGLGLPSMVAARAGADVLATDASTAAVVFARLNLALGGAGGEAAVLDVAAAAGGGDAAAPGVATAAGEAPASDARFDVVLAADVVYDRRNVAPLVALVPRLLAPGGTVWLADPGRPGLDELVAGMPAGADVRVEPAKHMVSA